MNIYPAEDRCEHNPDWECHTCTTSRHAVEHARSVDGCLACHTRTVRIYGRFTGSGSLSDAQQEFWATGSPEVFDRQDRAAQAARSDRRTKIG